VTLEWLAIPTVGLSVPHVLYKVAVDVPVASYGEWPVVAW
jgi:hypothetical protein